MQQRSVVHSQASHTMREASSTFVQLFGHTWDEQNDWQHCVTSQGSLSHSTSLALSIGRLQESGQAMELQYSGGISSTA